MKTNKSSKEQTNMRMGKITTKQLARFNGEEWRLPWGYP
jgi:hypothetical protein